MGTSDYFSWSKKSTISHVYKVDSCDFLIVSACLTRTPTVVVFRIKTLSLFRFVFSLRVSFSFSGRDLPALFRSFQLVLKFSFCFTNGRPVPKAVFIMLRFFVWKKICSNMFSTTNTSSFLTVL